MPGDGDGAGGLADGEGVGLAPGDGLGLGAGDGGGDTPGDGDGTGGPTQDSGLLGTVATTTPSMVTIRVFGLLGTVGVVPTTD